MFIRWLRLLVLTITVWGLAEGIGFALRIESQDAALPGTTRAMVNLRSGPGTRFDVVAVLPQDWPVTFVGRNASSTWLLTVTDDGTGWLSYTFVNVLGSVSDLPVVSGIPASSEAEGTSILTPPPLDPGIQPPMPGVIPQISATTRQIFLRGQELGNFPDVFSKIGDSITASVMFLTPVGVGRVELGEYEYLEAVIEFYSQTPARDHYSFATTSVAARGGWSTVDVLDSDRSLPGVCQLGETPLVCEYRINRPSVALIMLGTNDLNWMDSSEFRANMETIVQLSIDRGVIPVLSTIPDQPMSRFAGRVTQFNEIITEIAFVYDIPLWDYWLALQELPNRGLSSDNVHPSYDLSTQQTAVFTSEGLQYGYNMRNLTALLVLDALWRGAMY